MAGPWSEDNLDIVLPYWNSRVVSLLSFLWFDALQMVVLMFSALRRVSAVCFRGGMSNVQDAAQTGLERAVKCSLREFLNSLNG